jgi:glutamate synthase domain-containing protein 3
MGAASAPARNAVSVAGRQGGTLAAALRQPNTPTSGAKMETKVAAEIQLQPDSSGRVVLDAAGLHYRRLNELIRAAARGHAQRIVVVNVNGQRYIAAGLRQKVIVDVYGVPGNDLAAFMDGAEVVVHNNAQDAVGNTMNSGRVVVHGDAGDVIGYGMRGGKIFIRGDVGYRVGIHMKESPQQKPLLVVGGTAADFLGEYQAGGTLIVLGLRDAARRGSVVGDYCATGMHGGTLIVRGAVERARIASKFAALSPADEATLAAIEPALAEFCALFDYDLDYVLREQFWVVRPFSHKPFASNYAPNP